MELTTERLMTVREVADAFKCDERTIQRSVKKLFPDLVTHGSKTYLNELHVTAIKLDIEGHHNIVSTVALPKTKLEKVLLIKQAMAFQDEIIKELEQTVEVQQKRIDRLIHNNKTYTSTELAKELGLKSAAQLNSILANLNIQYKVNDTWVLYSKYSDCGYESIKQEELDNGKIIFNRHWTGKGRDFILNIVSENQF